MTGSSALKADKWFWACFALISTTVVATTFVPEFLPMIDLAGHESQLATWLHYHDPQYGFSKEFEANWFTPYLGAYALAYPIAVVASVDIAFRVTISAAALLSVLALRRLLRDSDADLWWCFLAIPAYFGISFQWGFINFLVGTPVAIYVIAVTLEHMRNPQRSSALRLAICVPLLFFSHAILLGLVGLVALILLLTNQPPSSWLRVGYPYAYGLALLVLYWLLRSDVVPPGLVWGNVGFSRLIELLASLVEGPSMDPERAGVVLFVVSVFLLLGGGWSRRWYLFVPVAVFGAAYAALPFFVVSTAFMYNRLDGLILISVVLATRAPERRRQQVTLRVYVLAIALISAMAVYRKAHEMSLQAHGFSQIAAAIPLNSRVEFIDNYPRNSFIPAIKFYQFEQYLVAQRSAVIKEPWGAIWFQLPFRRRRDFVVTPTVRYYVTLGSLDGVPKQAAVRKTVGDWTLLEQPP